MKFKHKNLNNVTVGVVDESDSKLRTIFIDFIDGIFETDDETLAVELRRNKNIIEIKEKKTKPEKKEEENKDE